MLLFAVLLGAACADTSAVRLNESPSESQSSVDDRLASGPFQLVDHEATYLNGVENEDRPPISFLLVGSDAADGSVTEAALVTAYVEAMRQDGWRLDPYSNEKAWWVFYGGRGSESARVGPASRFVELATADEGYVRPKFRRMVSELGEPLIVVSIDPRD